MKIRIKGNATHLRLSGTEVGRVVEPGRVGGASRFGLDIDWPGRDLARQQTRHANPNAGSL